MCIRDSGKPLHAGGRLPGRPLLCKDRLRREEDALPQDVYKRQISYLDAQGYADYLKQAAVDVAAAMDAVGL